MSWRFILCLPRFSHLRKITLSLLPTFSATRSTGDPPAPMNAEPAAMLEEDRDHIYHAHNEAEGGKVPIEEMILLPDMVNGLEEDRDHLYHDNREM